MQCLQIRPPPPYECKIYQFEANEITDLMPTTISMQAADRKFFSQNDLSQPSVLAFCHICSTASNRNNISNTMQPLPHQGTGQMQTYSSQGDRQLCVCATRPQKVPRFVTPPPPPSKQAAKIDTYPFFVSVLLLLCFLLFVWGFVVVVVVVVVVVKVVFFCLFVCLFVCVCVCVVFFLLLFSLPHKMLI